MASSIWFARGALACVLGVALVSCGDDRGAGEGPARGDDAGAPVGDVGEGADGGRTAAPRTDADPVRDGGAGTDGGPGADVVPGDTAAVDGAGPDAGDPPTGGRGGVLGVDPTSIFMTFTGEGVRVEAPITVSNGTDGEVTIERTELIDADPGFIVYDDPDDQVLAPGGRTTLMVRYESSRAPEARADVWIHNSLIGPLVVPVTATEKAGGGDDPPCVDVRPRRIDFGTVVRGIDPPIDRTFSVSNCGEGDIRISRFDRASVFFIPTPDSFQWTHRSTPFDLAPGETEEVTVTYTAGRAGLESGAIDVRTNVTGSETVRVDLRATSEPPPIEELDVHLILRWDVSGGSDVDFHFLRRDAELFSCDDCYYANMSPDWGVAGDIRDDPFLDRDDLEGPGPENINVDELPDGTYLINVHYYSDTGSGGGDMGDSPTSANATVEVYLGGALAGAYGPTHLESTDSTWDVASLDWPAGTLTALGRVYDLGSRGSCFGGF